MIRSALGDKSLQVSRLGLGTVQLGMAYGYDKQPPPPEDEAISIIRQALDMGINFIDTSNSYSRGKSEEFIGQAAKDVRHQLLLATKVNSPMGEGPNMQGNSRQHIMTEVEKSLQRLQTDYIDLYQIHFPDPQTPIEETLRALDDLVHQGKVRYIGCSNFSAWQVAEAYTLLLC